MSGTMVEPGRTDFIGEVTRRRVVPGFIASELSHRRPVRSEGHGHRRAYFSCLTSGAYVERDGGRETVYGTGDVRFHPAGFLHGDEIGAAGARFVCLELDGGRGAVLPGRPLLEPSLWPRSSEIARLAALLGGELRGGGPADDLVIEGLALQLVGTLARLPVENAMPRWLARVAERVWEEKTLPGSVSKLAAEAGVHPVHLARVWRKHFPRSIGEEIRRRRVEMARRAIESGDLPLADAAAAAGFSDQSHMSRLFRRFLGTSPAAYRRSIPSSRPARVSFRPKG